jgi:hypothetical protein
MNLYKKWKRKLVLRCEKIRSFWRDNVESSRTIMHLNSTFETKYPEYLHREHIFLQAVGQKIENYAAQVSMLVCIRKSSFPTGYFQGEFSLFCLVFSGKCSWVKINHHSLLTCCFKITIPNKLAVEAKSIYVLATKKWYSEIAVFFPLFSC